MTSAGYRRFVRCPFSLDDIDLAYATRDCVLNDTKVLWEDEDMSQCQVSPLSRALDDYMAGQVSRIFAINAFIKWE